MILFRRAAPTVIGSTLVLLGLTLTLTASAAPVGKLTLGDVLPAIGPTLAVLGTIVAVYRGTVAAMRGSARAEIALHDAAKSAHVVAAEENHRSIHEALDELNIGMATVLARLDVVARLQSEVRAIEARLRAIEDRNLRDDAARNPEDSPRRRRESDPDEFDGAGQRGQR